jgi:pimeloyl-ACP methyl ester carboxylesterase
LVCFFGVHRRDESTLDPTILHQTFYARTPSSIRPASDACSPLILLPSPVFQRANLSAPNLPGLLLLLAIGLATVYILGLVAVIRTLTRPPRRRAAWAIARGFATDPAELDSTRYGLDPHPFRTISAQAAGHTLALWELDGRDPQGPLVILTHGWNDSRVNALHRLQPILDRSSLTIAWDLPGHGDSFGRAQLGRTESHLLDALIARYHASPSQPVILFGWSMGAGIAIESALRLADRGVPVRLILEAPYTLPHIPAARVLAARGLPNAGLLPLALTLIGGVAWQRPTGPFDRRTLAARLAKRVPTLILHGTDDPVCPIADAQAIATAANATFTPIPGARHNDLWTNPTHRALCLAAIEQWL